MSKANPWIDEYYEEPWNSFLEANYPLDMILEEGERKDIHLWLETYFDPKNQFKRYDFFSKKSSILEEVAFEKRFIDFRIPYEKKDGKITTERVNWFIILSLIPAISEFISDFKQVRSLIYKIQELYIWKFREGSGYAIFHYFIYNIAKYNKLTNLYIFKKKGKFIPRILTEDQYLYYYNEMLGEPKNAIVINLNALLRPLWVHTSAPVRPESKSITKNIWEQKTLDFLRENKYSNISISFNRNNLQKPKQIELTRPLLREEIILSEIATQREWYGSYHLEFNKWKGSMGSVTTRVKLDKEKYPLWDKSDKKEFSEEDKELLAKKVESMYKNINLYSNLEDSIPRDE